MKGLLALLLISLSLGIQEVQVEAISCPSYKCTSDSLGDSVCLSQTSDNGVDTITLKACLTGYTCDKDSKADQTAYCVQSAAPSYNSKYNGQSCMYNIDCASNNCVLGYCKRKVGTDCTDTSICDPGEYCSNSSCVPLLQANQTGCSTDFDCKPGLGCMIQSAILPSKNTCVELFSVANGTDLIPQATNWICKSGVAEVTNTAESTGKCVEAPTTNGQVPKSCKASSDCLSTQVKTTGTSYSGTCTCGYNANGASYCSLFEGDTQYMKFYSKLKEWLDSGYANKCNSMARYNFDCTDTYWSKDDAVELRYLAAYATGYPKFYDSVDCAREIFEPNFAKDYNDYQSDDDFAVLLAIGGLLYYF